MNPRVSSPPPLPSRAVLAIGVMALVCLTLLATLLFQLTSPAPLLLDARADVPANAAEASIDSDIETVALGGDTPPVAAPLLDALDAAADGPLDAELARFLDAVASGFAEEGTGIPDALHPYAYRIAGRMNVRDDAFAIYVAAPDLGLAESRAETLRRLFDEAGAMPGRLVVTARSDAHALTLEPQ